MYTFFFLVGKKATLFVGFFNCDFGPFWGALCSQICDISWQLKKKVSSKWTDLSQLHGPLQQIQFHIAMCAGFGEGAFFLGLSVPIFARFLSGKCLVYGNKIYSKRGKRIFIFSLCTWDGDTSTEVSQS